MIRKNRLDPPDGGWGWVIMLAFIVNNIIIIPIQQNFALIFKELFNTIPLSGSKVTSIITTNMAVAALTGLATGPLIRRFEIRPVAIGGSLCFIVGILCTIFASTYWEFMLCYGIINGIGMGIIRLTSGLSLNLYFLKRRNKVSGITMGLKSLGSILMPQLVVFLLSTYGLKSTMLYIGGLSLHLLCGSLLLHPVRWHSKSIPIQNDMELKDLMCNDEEITNKNGILQKIIHFFDLTLFTNRTFAIIIFGMMFTAVADATFSILLVLILSDLNYSNERIAMFFSTSYTSNVIVRFMIPFLGDFLKRSSRFMYLMSISMIICGRFAILFINSTTFVAILWGTSTGIRTVYSGVILADNIPPEKLPSAESIQAFINGLLFILGGFLIGLIKDTTGSYIFSIYIFNGFTFLTVVMWATDIICKNIQKCRKRKTALSTYEKTHVEPEVYLDEL